MACVFPHGVTQPCANSNAVSSLMPIDSPFGLIAPIRDGEAAVAFMHLAERVLAIDFFEYLAEWAKIDAEDLDWQKPGVTKDGADYLQTSEKRIEFAEWLRVRLSGRVYKSIAPLW